MSFNHLSDDSCTYTRGLKENVGILSYILSPHRFENENKCRHELGLVAGTAVSHVRGNLVDLESELRGQTRYLTKCAARAARPLEDGVPITNDKTAPIDTKMVHLRPCQMISYKSVPMPPSMEVFRCSRK
jgi:hypothetical protein